MLGNHPVYLPTVTDFKNQNYLYIPLMNNDNYKL